MSFMGPIVQTPDQVRSWADRARAGEDIVYFEGERPGRTIGAFVRGLREAGLVTTTSKRGSDGQLRHIAQRLPDLRPSQVAARQRAPRGRANLPAKDGAMTTRAVLRILSQAAAHDLPCPTNRELAKRVGLPNDVAASYRVRRLVQSGKISVWEPGPTERRVVTIIATGKMTRRAQL